MTVPHIEEADLAGLAEAFPALDFTDDERRKVLLEASSKDVQAAPGSGKTTLLGVKLVLLAAKWRHTNRGVCVLSHTNVAREEIAGRLRKSAVGARLLAYPHFVGTIHGFVNQFLALPLLRSDGNRLEAVDNDIFAARARAGVQRKYVLRNWVAKNQYQGPRAIETLRYEGPTLELGWEEGNLPGRLTDSFKQARELKDELAEQGYFRHDDMFAFAEKLLARFPEMSKRLSWRFPFVLIDEMQDTNSLQEALLTKAFVSSVIVQRCGDRNQRILSSESTDTAGLTFPRADCLHISSTKRFAEPIADAVRAVQEHGEPIAARVDETVPAPVLILYDASSATKVIDEFGALVLSKFSDDMLASGPTKAVCGRKKCEAKQPPGRHLVDYWPDYSSNIAISSGQECVRQLLRAPAEMGVTPISLDSRTRDVRRAILLCLRATKVPAVSDVYDASGIERKLEFAGIDATPLRRLCRNLVLARDLTSEDSVWEVTLDCIYDGLFPLLPNSVTRAAFRALPLFAEPLGSGVARKANECVVTRDGRSVRVQVGTIHSVKGETHLATLVLESHGGKSKKFDLQEALPLVANGGGIAASTSDLLKGQYRNLYVAMSRPRHFLCAAANKDRVQPDTLSALRARGWGVVEI
jgi:hypothetical protein